MPLRPPSIPLTRPPGVTPGERRITYEQLLNKPGTAGSTGTIPVLPVSAIPVLPPSKILGQTTTTRKFLRSQGNGTVAGVPTWDTLIVADLTGDVANVRKFPVSLGTGAAAGVTVWDRVKAEDVVAGSFDGAGSYKFGAGGANMGAPLSSCWPGTCFEFGHSNPNGYHSTLGAEFATGKSFFALHGEAGATAGTYKTRGFIASLVRSDLAGGWEFGTVANANADSQAFVRTALLSGAGTLSAGAVNYSSGVFSSPHSVGSGLSVPIRRPVRLELMHGVNPLVFRVYYIATDGATTTVTSLLDTSAGQLLASPGGGGTVIISQNSGVTTNLAYSMSVGSPAV